MPRRTCQHKPIFRWRKYTYITHRTSSRPSFDGIRTRLRIFTSTPRYLPSFVSIHDLRRCKIYIPHQRDSSASRAHSSPPSCCYRSRLWRAPWQMRRHRPCRRERSLWKRKEGPGRPPRQDWAPWSSLRWNTARFLERFIDFWLEMTNDIRQI